MYDSIVGLQPQMGMIALIFVIVIVIGYLLAATKREPTAVASQTTAQPIGYSGRSYPFSEITNDRNFPHMRSIHTKIRGVTHENPDGVNRQKIIRQWCHAGDALFLVREPNNPVGRNAIQVRRIVYSSDNREDNPRLGEQIGYVSHELAEDIAPKMDHDGFVLMAWIMNVTGGEDGCSLGVNIQVEEYRPLQHPSPSHQKAALPTL